MAMLRMAVLLLFMIHVDWIEARDGFPRPLWTHDGGLPTDRASSRPWHKFGPGHRRTPPGPPGRSPPRDTRPPFPFGHGSDHAPGNPPEGPRRPALEFEPCSSSLLHVTRGQPREIFGGLMQVYHAV